MAKNASRAKKSGQKKPVRRRRVSGVGSGLTNSLMEVGGLLGGIVVSNMVGSKLFPTMSPKIKGLVLVGAGVLLKGSMGNNQLIKSVATGVAVGGGYQLLQGFNVISGRSDGAMLLLPNQGVNQMIAGNGLNAVVAGGHYNRPAISGTGIDASLAAVI